MVLAYRLEKWVRWGDTNSELCLMDTINTDNIETWISGVWMFVSRRGLLSLLLYSFHFYREGQNNKYLYKSFIYRRDVQIPAASSIGWLNFVSYTFVIFGSSLWNFISPLLCLEFYIPPVVPRILRWLLNLWKICVPVMCQIFMLRSMVFEICARNLNSYCRHANFRKSNEMCRRKVWAMYCSTL